MEMDDYIDRCLICLNVSGGVSAKGSEHLGNVTNMIAKPQLLCRICLTFACQTTDVLTEVETLRSVVNSGQLWTNHINCVTVCYRPGLYTIVMCDLHVNTFKDGE